MKIIAGRLKGHHFKSPNKASVHPMSDKIRGALFNSLGDIIGLDVLDGYSGSGAISLEAASRGANRVTSIDIDRTANLVIKENINKLDLNNVVKAIRANLYRWSNLNKDTHFDVIILDPPYQEFDRVDLERIKMHLKNSGVLVVSLPPKANLGEVGGLTLIRENKYGDAKLVFYKKVS